MKFKLVSISRRVDNQTRVFLDYSKSLISNLSELRTFIESDNLSSDSISISPLPSEAIHTRHLQLRHIIMLELLESISTKKDSVEGLLVSSSGTKQKQHYFSVRTSLLKSITPGKYIVLHHPKGSLPRMIIADFNGKNHFTFKDTHIINKQDEVDILGGILSFQRAYDAFGKSVSRDIDSVLNGHIQSFWVETPSTQAKALIMSVCQQLLEPKILNDNQLTSVSRFVDAKQGLQLLVGPPGTGKTTTTIALIAALVQQGHTVLASASSNQAVQNIARLLNKQCPTMPIELLASVEKVPEDLHSLIRNDVKGHTDARTPVVYLATLSSMGSKLNVKRIKQGTDNQQGFVLIVDEAGQSPQYETLIPMLQYNPLKTLLIGDPNQLPPVILSDEAKALKADSSLMATLIDTHHQPYSILNEQFRMHPEISLFPRQLVYGGELKDSDYVQSRPSFLDDAPYGLINVPYSEEITVNGSYANVREARAVIKLAKFFHQKGAQHIAAITPYIGQLGLIKDELSKTSARPPLLVSTVDSFQGGEVDVLILSLVRSNAQGKIGFLKDPRRFNVALTRGKHIVRVVCDVPFFDPFRPKGRLQFDISSLLKDFRTIPKAQDEDASDSFSEIEESLVCKGSVVGFRGPRDTYQNTSQESHAINDFLDRNNLRGMYYDEYYDYVSSLLAEFQPAHHKADLFNGFQRMLASAHDDKPLFLGDMEVFHHPFLPRGTHIVQDVLNRVKNWESCSLEGVPDDTFGPIFWTTYYKNTDVEEFEDYGYPFDEYDNYQSCGYSIGQNRVFYQEIEMKQADLRFENISFKNTNLKNVDFHNSYFVNVNFEGANTVGMKVNLHNMDQDSRVSFLSTQGLDRPTIGFTSEHNIAQMLIADAKHRGLTERL